MKAIRVLVVGLGNMGLSHARAYQAIDGFEIAGLCSLDIESRDEIAREFQGAPRFLDYARALSELRPDAVSINTWPDTHAAFAKMALDAGCHVFIEKPLAGTVAEAEEILALAKSKDLKVAIGYILRVHPSWTKFVEIGRTLGKPLVMRMNLNQQSSGAQWTGHKHLMATISPIVDCGVHYVDVMCQVTGAKPLRVHAVGARLTDEISERTYNYGHLHVAFDVSHARTSALRRHHAPLGPDGELARPDEMLRTDDEPGHQELCNREQRAFLAAIRNNEDLTEHARGAVDSLRIVLAADESVRTGQVVSLL